MTAPLKDPLHCRCFPVAWQRGPHPPELVHSRVAAQHEQRLDAARSWPHTHTKVCQSSCLAFCVNTCPQDGAPVVKWIPSGLEKEAG